MNDDSKDVRHCICLYVKLSRVAQRRYDELEYASKAIFEKDSETDQGIRTMPGG